MTARQFTAGEAGVGVTPELHECAYGAALGRPVGNRDRHLVHQSRGQLRQTVFDHLGTCLQPTPWVQLGRQLARVNRQLARTLSLRKRSGGKAYEYLRLRAWV